MSESIINLFSKVRDAFSEARNVFRAGVNSKDETRRNAVIKEHKILAPLVSLVTRPDPLIQTSAGYKQNSTIPVQVVKDDQFEGTPGKIIRVLAFNDRIAAGASDFINSLTNGPLGSVGMVAGIVMGSVVRAGIFLSMTTAETLVGLMAMALLGAAVLVALPALVVASPVLIPLVVSAKNAEKAFKSEFEKKVEELKAERERIDNLESILWDNDIDIPD